MWFVRCSIGSDEAICRRSTTWSLSTTSITLPRRRVGRPRETLRHVDHDIRQTGVEVHHLFGDERTACVHMTIRGVHEASTMPLLVGVPVTRRDVTWRYIHIFRVANGQLAEHWAARDDVDLLRQVGAWSPPQV